MKLQAINTPAVNLQRPPSDTKNYQNKILAIFLLALIVSSIFLPILLIPISFQKNKEIQVRNPNHFCSSEKAAVIAAAHMAPKPQKHPKNPSKILNWIESFPLKHQKLAAKFAKNLRHIPQEEFEKSLHQSVKQFNDWMQAEKVEHYGFLSFSPSLRKSDTWVTQLALPYFEKTPVFKIFDKDFLTESHQNFYKYLEKYPKAVLVMLDDAIYSGEQRISFITRLYIALGSISIDKKSKSLFYNRKIAIITPYISSQIDSENITQRVLQNLSSIKKEEVLPQSKDIRLFFAEKLKPLQNFLNEEELDILGCDSSDHHAFFDHKLPDDLSVCRHQIVHLIGDFAPPYKDTQRCIPYKNDPFLFSACINA